MWSPDMIIAPPAEALLRAYSKSFWFADLNNPPFSGTPCRVKKPSSRDHSESEIW